MSLLQVSLLSLVPQSHHLHRDDLPKQLGCGDLLAEDTVGIFQQQSYVATEEQERLNRFPEASLSKQYGPTCENDKFRSMPKNVSRFWNSN